MKKLKASGGILLALGIFIGFCGVFATFNTVPSLDISYKLGMFFGSALTMETVGAVLFFFNESFKD